LSVAGVHATAASAADHYDTSPDYNLGDNDNDNNHDNDHNNDWYLTEIRTGWLLSFHRSGGR
jgi:hypothetical protein